MSINKEGLCLKRIEEFSIAFRYKWMWQILEENDSSRLDVLRKRYDNLNHMVLTDSSTNNLAHRSSWWNDILSLEKRNSEEVFTRNCRFSLGNMDSIPFWNAFWHSDGCLKDVFPELFALSSLKKNMVARMGCWINNR